MSDIRLKKNITPIASALENPSKITGVYFNWKDEARDRADGRRMGLIAQDVEKVYPEAVITNSDGTKALNYDSMIGPLVEAVKKLNLKVEQQQKEIDELKVEIAKLKGQ